jgi:hypothetical protein
MEAPMTEYLRQPPAPTAAQLAEIERLEASSKRSYEAAEESFQRCDTDGFLSQWALQSSSSVDNANIRILKNGGYVAVRVLCDAEGNIVSDRIRTFPHPMFEWRSVSKWDLGRNAERRWVPMGDKSRVQKQLGLHEESRYVRGYAKITAPAGARGLSGCASAYVGHFRSDTDEEV